MTDRHFVLRAVFAAPDDETAQKRGTEIVTPLLRDGSMFYWDVVETRELLTVEDQAAGLLADADEQRFGPGFPGAGGPIET